MCIEHPNEPGRNEAGKIARRATSGDLAGANEPISAKLGKQGSGRETIRATGRLLRATEQTLAISNQDVIPNINKTRSTGEKGRKGGSYVVA